jgi:hypothetical protein
MLSAKTDGSIPQASIICWSWKEKRGLIAKTVTVDQVADASTGEEVLKEMGR